MAVCSVRQAAPGTPYFMARTGPCEMCEEIPCVAACPTNALDHGLSDIEQSRMGPVILSADCTNCGRCIDICSKQVFAFGTRNAKAVEVDAPREEIEGGARA
jgi:Fe-S-cluster-containing hydrogenase component 2